MIRNAPEEELRSGNITEAPPSHILRQALSQRRKEERFSTEMTDDLMSLMEFVRATDTMNNKLPGAIHHLGKYPFVVHVYVEQLLRKYDSERTTLHLDATGSVTSQVGGKRPFLYAVVVGPTAGPSSSYPLAHMLSEDHTIPTIVHFLSQLCRSHKIITNKPLKPPRVGTDLSWALLHGVTQGICDTFLRDYLEVCWTAACSEGPVPVSLISFCGAHLSKKFSDVLKEKKVPQECRPGFQLIFARMQQAKNLTELSSYFSTMCRYALSKKQQDMSGLGTCTVESADVDSGPLPEVNSTLRLGTSFGRHFHSIVLEVTEACTKEDSGERKNPYFCPQLTSYLTGVIMPLVPLWTQVLSGGTVVKSAVESHFNVIKAGVLRGRTNNYPCVFIRLLIEDVWAHAKRTLVPGVPVQKSRKRRNVPERRATASTKGTSTNNSMLSPSTQEETWSKRNKKTKKPTFYAQVNPPMGLCSSVMTPDIVIEEESSALATTSEVSGKEDIQSPSSVTERKIPSPEICTERLVQPLTEIPGKEVQTLPSIAPVAVNPAASLTAKEVEPVAMTSRVYSLTLETATLIPNQGTSQNRDAWSLVARFDQAAKDTLRPGAWLMGNVIDLFCLALSSVSSGRVVHLDCTWQISMKGGRSKEQLRLRLREGSAHLASIWLLPYNRDSVHWALYVVHIKSKVITHVDSLNWKPNAQDVQFVQRLVQSVNVVDK